MKNNVNNKWTEEDDNTLKSIISNANSVGEGIVLAASTLNRSESTCSVRLFKLRKKGFVYASKYKKKSYIEEAKILKEEIIKSPWNLKNAFKRTSEKTNLKPETIESYYYGLRKNNPMYKGNLGVCFMLVSINQVLVNSKNSLKND